MSGDVKRRRYRSERRREQAAQTRARVLAAAAGVFRERGYERASIAAIAAAAGVADETVYAHFRNKRTLLGELVRDAVRGDDPRPVPEQEAPARLVEAVDARELLHRFADDVARRLERAAPLVAVVAAAAPGEPELAELLRLLHEDRSRNLGRAVDALAAAARLRVPHRDALDAFWALTSPELYELLTGLRGWSRRRYTTWLAASLERLLVEDAP